MGDLKMFRFLFILFLLPYLAFADTEQTIKDANELFDKANELALKDPDLSKKLYKSTVLKYQQLIEQGVKNPQIYTNLGNAYFFAGDKGRSLLSYQRAYRLDPSDENINHNIEFLRAQSVDVPPNSVSKVFKYIFIWHSSSFQGRLTLFTMLNILFWLSLAYMLYSKKRQVQWICTSSLILGLILLASLLTTAMQWDNSVDGIITEREVTPRQGNGYIYEMALSGPLHSGSEFKLLETRKNWYYIELPGGSKCWIPSRSSTLVEE